MELKSKLSCMKKIILFCAALFFVINAKAQFPGMGGGAAKPTVVGRVTAVVIDSATKKPIDYATVSLVKLKDNKPVNGGLTDEKGKVVLQNIAANEYKLVIGFIGYTTKSITLKTTAEKPDNNVGTIALSASSSTLNQVTIEGTKPLIESKIDKVVYNAEQDVTIAGGNASDVLRKVPLLSVDIDGNPSLRGSNAVRVLINGKPSGTMANNVADALKMIPAEEIKSVEVITSPSAKYDAEGAGGIINIITKKKTAQGVSGTAALALGTRQNNGNFSLNAKNGRLGFTSNVGGQYAIPQNTRIFLENSDYVNNFSSIQDGYSKANRYGFNGSAGLDYDINGYNNISTNIRFSNFNNGADGSIDVLLKNAINTIASTRITENNGGMNNIDWSADYRKTSKKPGKEFSISAQASFGRNTNEFNTRFISAMPTVTNGNNTGKNNEYTMQTDYVYPVTKTVNLETGLKGVFRTIASKYQNTNQDFDYSQDVAAAYGVINFNLTKKIALKGGLRAEYTKINGLSGNAVNFENDYFNLFPSLILSQTLKNNTTLKLSYNKRMTRPSLAYLNPFLNDADPLNQSAGNPALNPELSDNFELGYSTFIKGSIINASVFYRQTNDIIESFYSTRTAIVNGAPRQTGFTTFQNIGTSESYGFNLFGSYNPMPKWTLMANFGLNTYEVINQQTNISTGTFANYNVFARSAISFKGGWNAEVFGVLTSKRRTFQGVTEALKFYGGAVKKDIMKKKATVGLNVFNVFSRDLHIETTNSSAAFLQRTNIYYPIRSFGVNFSYNFGKINYSAKPKAKKVNNDDLKKEEQQGGQLGGMGGNGG